MFSLTMQPLHFAHDQELEIFVLKKDIKILSLQSYFHFSLKIYILLGILCLKSSFRSVLDFRVACLSLRNFENSRTFSSLAFSGGLSINGDDDGARAQTDESTSFGLSNCSRIAGSPISAKKGENRMHFLILIHMYSKGFWYHQCWLKLREENNTGILN